MVVVKKYKKIIQKKLTIKDFNDRRNKILIIRQFGGLGDIFMHRMLFEDIKDLIPDASVHFACPSYYHDAVKDHPYIDVLLDSKDVKKEDFLCYYNTSTACNKVENTLAPLSAPHRSDIWATHCGYELKKHEMHISLSPEEQSLGKQLIEETRDRPGLAIAVCPISAHVNKNLLDKQLIELVDGLRDRGCYVFGLHNEPILTLLKKDVPCISLANIRKWMAVIHQADGIVSVDTASFHCAGGMGKPLVGIFTYADGLVYGKYFDFELVQKHRELENWTCGPCYNWTNCPKTRRNPKPCLTEITSKNMLDKVDVMLAKIASRTLLSKETYATTN